MLYGYVLLTCFGQVWHIGINEKRFHYSDMSITQEKTNSGRKMSHDRLHFW